MVPSAFAAAVQRYHNFRLPTHGTPLLAIRAASLARSRGSTRDLVSLLQTGPSWPLRLPRWRIALSQLAAPAPANTDHRWMSDAQALTHLYTVQRQSRFHSCCLHANTHYIHKLGTQATLFRQLKLRTWCSSSTSSCTVQDQFRSSAPLRLSLRHKHGVRLTNAV